MLAWQLLRESSLGGARLSVTQVECPYGGTINYKLKHVCWKCIDLHNDNCAVCIYLAAGTASPPALHAAGDMGKAQFVGSTNCHPFPGPKPKRKRPKAPCFRLWAGLRRLPVPEASCGQQHGSGELLALACFRSPFLEDKIFDV